MRWYRRAAASAQLVAYVLAGLGLLAWALADMWPAAARYRPRALPVILGVIAVAGGFACTAGSNENNCPVMLASMATTGAGTEIGLGAGWLVSAASIVAIDANWLIYRDGSSQLSAFLLFPLVPLTGLLFGRVLYGRRVQAEQSTALLAHSLGALVIQIQAARAVLTDHQDIDRAVEILLTAQRMASDGLTETRRAVHALRSDSRPLDEELRRATATYGERYDVKVTLAIGGTPRPVPPDATVALLRTAQEALVNAAKHAPGQCVAVRLDFGAHEVRLTVVNGLASDRTGPAGPGTITGGYGLTGMRERLRLLNGTLAAGPGDRQWTVTAERPLASADPPLAPADQPQEVTS